MHPPIGRYPSPEPGSNSRSLPRGEWQRTTALYSKAKFPGLETIIIGALVSIGVPQGIAIGLVPFIQSLAVTEIVQGRQAL